MFFIKVPPTNMDTNHVEGNEVPAPAITAQASDLSNLMDSHGLGIMRLVRSHILGGTFNLGQMYQMLESVLKRRENLTGYQLRTNLLALLCYAALFGHRDDYTAAVLSVLRELEALGFHYVATAEAENEFVAAIVEPILAGDLSVKVEVVVKRVREHLVFIWYHE